MPLSFRRASGPKDMHIVRQIMTTPSIYRQISDDGSAPVEQFQPVDHPAVWYVLVIEDEEVIGCFMFHPENSVTWQVHTCLMPAAIAKGLSLDAARGGRNWIWRNTTCCRIVTVVPEHNRLALRFAQNAGMIEWGRNPASWLKHGKLWTTIHLGMSRPEE